MAQIRLTALARALREQQLAHGIPSLLQLSRKIGVAYGSIYFLMMGRRAGINSRTTHKYAKFLKRPVAEIRDMALPMAGRATSTTVRAVKARAAKWATASAAPAVKARAAKRATAFAAPDPSDPLSFTA